MLIVRLERGMGGVLRLSWYIDTVVSFFHRVHRVGDPSSMVEMRVTFA